PLRSDLVRTLEEGIEGTAMPSFNVLPKEDLENLASYVIHLSIRGETEFQTLRDAFEYDKDKNALKVNTKTLSDLELNSVSEYVAKIAQYVGKQWLESQDMKIKVASYPYGEAEMQASIERGRALFLAEESKLKELFPDAKLKKAELDKLKGAS